LYNIGSGRFMTQSCWWGTHMATDGAGKVITISGSADAYNLHMAGVNASKWLSGGAYTDTDPATSLTVTTDPNLKWTFETVSLDGYTNVYKIKNNSTQSYLRSYAADVNTGHKVELEAFSDDNQFYWLLISKTTREETLNTATSANPVDATFKVTNPDGEWYIRYENDTWKEYSHGGWSGTFSHNSTVQSYYVSSFYEIWAGNSATGNGTKVGNNWHLNDFDEYNNITRLPNGKYRVTMAVEATQQTDPEEITGAYLYAAATQNGQTAVSTRGNYSVDCVVTGGTLRTGVKTVSTTANWVSFDNLRLTYYGNAVEVYNPDASVSFSSGGSASENTWYEVTIENAGIYKVASTAAITFCYTQDKSDDADETANVGIAASGSSTIVLEAGKIYFKCSSTSTITISPFVLDGTYYLYDATNKLFLGKGKNWGTRAVVDKYGVPFTWTAATGLISFVDQADTYLFFDKSTHSDCWLYTDGAAGKGDDRLMAFTDAGDGKVYLQDAAKAVWIKHDNSVLDVPVTAATNATKWTIMTKAEHDAIVNAYPADNKTAVITASGISITAGDFDTYLDANYASVDKTALINAVSSNNSKGDGWTWTGTQRTNAGYPSYDPSPYASLWKNTGYYTYTVSKSNLPAGIYKLEMQGFDRRQNRNSEATLYETYGNIGSSYLEANGQKVRIMNAEEMFAAHKTADPSWTINREWAGQLSSLDGNYAPNTVYVYLDGNTDLNLTIEKPDYTDDACLVIGPISMTYYNLNTKTILENKGDITSLINGEFETDLAGWTGGKRVTDLARSWRSSSVVNNFMERTESGTMTCTLSNMPAGTYKVVAAARAAAGCKITPQIAGTSGATLTGVGDAQSAASEINMNGVQMPYSALGGFTTNELGHNWQWITATGTLAEDGDLVINFVTDASGKTGSGSWMPIDDVHLYCTHLNAPSTDYTESMSIITENIDVNNTGNSSVVTADIILSNPNAVITSDAAINGAAGTQINNNLVSGTIANMVLYDGHDFTPPVGEYAATAAKLYRTITADKWSTLMLPFVPTTTFTAKMLPSKLDGEGVLFFEDATPANDSPILVKNESTLTEIIGARESAATGSKTAGADVPMQGVYARQGVPVSTGSHFYYIVGADDNELHKVTGDAVMISAFRAYFDLDDASYVKGNTIIMNFGDETCIKSMDKEQLTNDNAAIYNLAGQRISKPTKGINIINGKKVLVK